MYVPSRAELAVRAATTPTDWQDASLLLHEYAAWIRAEADFDLTTVQPEFQRELDDPAAAYADDTHATFLLARWGGGAAGTVALRVAPSRRAELKRLYVRPAARGRGVADALVAAALDHAGRLGARSLWLETKRGLMDRAIAVYERHGFRRLPEPATLGLEGAVTMHRQVTAARRAS